MRKLLRWAGVVLLALLLAVIGLWLLSRALGPSDEQEAALASLESAGPAPGRNAFAALWLLTYDVPEGAQDAIVAQDAASFARLPLPNADAYDPAQAPRWQTAAATRFAKLAPSAKDWERFCKSSQPGCLAKVKADRDGYAALLERNRKLIERSAELRKFGHYRNALPVRMDMPFPSFQYAIAPLTRHALAFADGDRDAALAGACADLSAWRRVGTHSDSLIVRMVGIAFATDGYARLIADMMAELPPDHALPAECAAALATPSAEEGLLCEAMKGEWAYVRSGMQAIAKEPRPTGGAIDYFFPVLFDADMTDARLAVAHARTCAASARAGVAADTPADFSGEARGWRFDCVGNAAGCVLADISGDAHFERYAWRAQDNAARLRLLGALLWLREHADGNATIAQALRKLPPAFASPGHPIEIADGGKALRIRQFDDTREAYWQVPLPQLAADRSSRGNGE